MVTPNLIWVLLFGMAWSTPETTDFDVYHPHRHNYLVKTTLLGGGNFANKLSPGNLYVWMGVKPVESLRGEDKTAWTEKNPCEDLMVKENVKIYGAIMKDARWHNSERLGLRYVTCLFTNIKLFRSYKIGYMY